MSKVMSNILEQPEEERFRRLKLSNPKIQKTILEVAGAVEMLALGGFKQTVIPSPIPTTSPLPSPAGANPPPTHEDFLM